MICEQKRDSLDYLQEPTFPSPPSQIHPIHLHMRPAQEPELASLPAEECQEMLCRHIPYRKALLEDSMHRIPAHTLQDHQAFEAGAVSGRILLSFLGVGYSENVGKIKPEHNHKLTDGKTDDVKVQDVGGHFVKLSDLTENEAEVLAKFIRGAHKACAHFTIGSQHDLDVPTYKQAVPIILRLLRDCLPLAPLP
jgi:hypothetical protein